LRPILFFSFLFLEVEYYGGHYADPV